MKLKNRMWLACVARVSLVCGWCVCGVWVVFVCASLGGEVFLDGEVHLYFLVECLGALLLVHLRPGYLVTQWYILLGY